ncbi:MAG: carbon-nitrogen hydrolase family protein [Clostridiales bacterium]|nr:carbon-nitrogen hydrolase family protein [Clostridiales bacterium]
MMRAAALSFAGSDFITRQGFKEHVYKTVPPGGDDELLLVFPQHLALLLAFRCKELGQPLSLAEAFAAFMKLPHSWHREYLNMQHEIARSLSAYLVPGSLWLQDGGIYSSSCLISPGGEMLGYQRQIFLSRQERELGLSRGEEAEVFETGIGRLGIIIGTDAWYPEVGRVLALKGAEVVCHCGALSAGENRWLQLAGMWQQVQQNQFFCVESQLAAEIAGQKFAAESLLHAPCEMTAGFEGILARGGLGGEPVSAELDKEKRLQVVNSYPLLKLLNPMAYEDMSGGECK